MGCNSERDVTSRSHQFLCKHFNAKRLSAKRQRGNDENIQRCAVPRAKNLDMWWLSSEEKSEVSSIAKEILSALVVSPSMLLNRLLTFPYDETCSIIAILKDPFNHSNFIRKSLNGKSSSFDGFFSSLKWVARIFTSLHASISLASKLQK